MALDAWEKAELSESYDCREPRPDIIEVTWQLLDNDPGAGVYVILALDRSLVKIGFTTSLWRRWRQLQVASPDRLEILHFFLGEKQDEKSFHALFQEQQVQGEWFAYEGKLAAFLDSIEEELCEAWFEYIDNPDYKHGPMRPSLFEAEEVIDKWIEGYF